jgi:hypothetical protein
VGIECGENKREWSVSGGCEQERGESNLRSGFEVEYLRMGCGVWETGFGE